MNIFGNEQKKLFRKEEFKKFFPVFLFILSLTILVNAGLLILLKIIIPSYEIITGSKSNYLIFFGFVIPFALIYAYVIYSRLYKKVFDEIRLRQNIIKALKRSEERYKTLFNNASDAIVIHDFDGVILEANKAACDTLKYSREELISLNISDIELSRNNIFENSLPEMEFQNVQSYEAEYLDKNKIPISVEINMSVIDYNESMAVMIIARNITERKKAEEQLLVYQQQLRNLASKIPLVQEEERRKIAVELHDFIGPNLTFSKLKLQIFLKGNNGETSSVNEALNLIDQTIPYVRNLTASLSPPILYDLNFKSAMEWLCEHVQKNFMLDVKLVFDDEINNIKLDDNTRVILFQSARELLTNAAKHSGVNGAELTVKKEDKSIYIIVVDNGKGFDTGRLFKSFDDNCGFGLFSIKERVEYAGGNFTIQSEIDKFTRIILRVPL